MKILPLIAFPICVGACTFGWYGFNSLQPKNLKEYLEWQGFKLASSDNTWQSIITEHKDLVNSLFGDGENKDKLKSWCKEHLLVVDFSPHIERASKLCVDNVGTIEGKLVRDGVKLDQFFKNEDSDDVNNKYKVAYVFRKHNTDFLSLIGHTPEEEEREFEPALTKYKEWCKGTLKAKLDSTLLENFKTFCKPKSFSTIKQYLDTLGPKYLTDPENSQELRKVHEKIGSFQSYKKDIEAEGEDALKTWCEDNLKKDFSSRLNLFSDTLPKVKSRCTIGGVIADS